mgnify:CR=1 FL=1
MTGGDETGQRDGILIARSDEGAAFRFVFQKDAGNDGADFQNSVFRRKRNGRPQRLGLEIGPDFHKTVPEMRIRQRIRTDGFIPSRSVNEAVSPDEDPDVGRPACLIHGKKDQVPFFRPAGGDGPARFGLIGQGPGEEKAVEAVDGHRQAAAIEPVLGRGASPNIGKFHETEGGGGQAVAEVVLRSAGRPGDDFASGGDDQEIGDEAAAEKRSGRLDRLLPRPKRPDPDLEHPRFVIKIEGVPALLPERPGETGGVVLEGKGARLHLVARRRAAAGVRRGTERQNPGPRPARREENGEDEKDQHGNGRKRADRAGRKASHGRMGRFSVLIVPFPSQG